MATAKKAKKQTKPGKKSAAKVTAKQAAPKRAVAKRAAPKKAAAKPDTGPSLFRINVEVGDLDRAATLYEALLGIPGRRQAGSRVYFTCGAVTIQMVDVSSRGAPHPAAKALYFLVDDLDGVHARAKKLGILSQELVHGQVGGAISVRPWGERSFYADDPWQNPLCFVQTGTTYPG